MNVKIQSRTFTDELATLPVKFLPERYSHNVYGGPKLATINVAGSENDLWELIERLRCPLTIFTDKGDASWWGFIAEIELRIGAWAVGVTIDSMFNKIAVAWATVAAGEESSGSRDTTDWSSNTESIKEYGIKELLQSVSGGTEAYALAAQAMLLASKKYPIPTITPNDDKTALNAVLRCRGWWDILAWRYAPVPVRLAYAYEGSAGNADYVLGDDTADVQAYAQAIDTGPTALNVQSIEIYVAKVGAPTDNLRVALWTNPDDLTPASELANKAISGEAISETAGWVLFTFDSPVEMEASGTYFIVVDRSGALDNSNYFEVRMDSAASYTAGVLRQKVADAWGAGPSADMLFRLYTNDIVETSQQVRSLAATYGQFLTGVDLGVASGITTESYRDGDASALFEIEELLSMGTSNNRRMLATVDQNRRLRIYEEPTSANPYFLLKNGELHDAFDVPVRKETCPVGMWAKLKDVIPGSVDLTKLSDPSLMFVDEAEYEVATDTLRLTPRGVEDPMEIGRAQNG